MRFGVLSPLPRAEHRRAGRKRARGLSEAADRRVSHRVLRPKPPDEAASHAAMLRCQACSGAHNLAIAARLASLDALPDSMTLAASTDWAARRIKRDTGVFFWFRFLPRGRKRTNKNYVDQRTEHTKVLYLACITQIEFNGSKTRPASSPDIPRSPPGRLRVPGRFLSCRQREPPPPWD